MIRRDNPSITGDLQLYLDSESFYKIRQEHFVEVEAEESSSEQRNLKESEKQALIDHVLAQDSIHFAMEDQHVCEHGVNPQGIADKLHGIH